MAGDPASRWARNPLVESHFESGAGGEEVARRPGENIEPKEHLARRTGKGRGEFPRFAMVPLACFSERYGAHVNRGQQKLAIQRTWARCRPAFTASSLRLHLISFFGLYR